MISLKQLISVILALCLLAPVLHAQSFSIDWYQISAGGGVSAGTNGSAVYSVSGSIGQHEAGGAMTGGNYSMTGGFWSFIFVVQTVGLPNLTVSRAGNSVIIFWANTGDYTLQQNNNIAIPSGWTKSGYSISASNGTNSISITPPAGNLFFRLSNP